MNWDLVEGNWHQFKGKVLVRWSTLIGDHLGVISGKRQQVAGARQAAFGDLREKPLRGSLSAYSPAHDLSSNTATAGDLPQQSSGMAMPTREKH